MRVYCICGCMLVLLLAGCHKEVPHSVQYSTFADSDSCLWAGVADEQHTVFAVWINSPQAFPKRIGSGVHSTSGHWTGTVVEQANQNEVTWDCWESFGDDGKITIRQESFDLKVGRLFLIDVRHREIVVTQVDTDITQRDFARIKAENPTVRKFFAESVKDKKGV